MSIKNLFINTAHSTSSESISATLIKKKGFIMGFVFGLIRRLIEAVFFFLLLAAIVTLIPNLPPYTSFSTIDLDPYKVPDGSLKDDGSLNKVERLFKGKVYGPETLKVFNDDIYTSIATGEIVKISPGGHITFVTKIGKPCASLLEEHICGRILGFDIDQNKRLLYVADTYHGIWKVDLSTDKKTRLVSPDTEIEGKKPKLFNTIVVARNGDLYWTDSSSDYQLKDGVFTLFSDPSGRLFHYDAAKNKNKVLIDNIWFANGVALSPNEDFVVVTETWRSKALKYYLTGPKKGQTEDFITGLPGFPDNIQVLPDGSGILISLYAVPGENEPQIVRSLAKTPLLRKFVARIMRLTELALEAINNVFKNIIFEDLTYKIGHFGTLPALMTPKSGFVYVDWSGKVIKTYFNTDGIVEHTSDVTVLKDKLYLGAPHNRDFIASVPAPPELRKAFASRGTQKTAPKQQKPEVKQQKSEVKTEKPVVKEQKPVVKDQKTEQKPVAKEEKTVAKEQKPVVKELKPTVQEQKPVVKESKPTVQEQKPVVKESKPTVQEQKPVVKESKPTVQEQKPVVKEPKPTVQDKKPVVKDQKPAVKEQKPVVQEKKAQTKDPKPTEEKQKTTTKPEAAKLSTPKPPKAAEPKPDKKDSREKIPIEETIPSDTAKPKKETLKVIKKDGPAEIPNPKL